MKLHQQLLEPGGTIQAIKGRAFYAQFAQGNQAVSTADSVNPQGRKSLLEQALYTTNNIANIVNLGPYSDAQNKFFPTFMIMGGLNKSQKAPLVADLPDNIAVNVLGEALKLAKLFPSPFIGCNMGAIGTVLHNKFWSQSLLHQHTHVGNISDHGIKDIQLNQKGKVDLLEKIFGEKYDSRNRMSLYLGSQTEQVLLEFIQQQLNLNTQFTSYGGLTNELTNQGLNITIPQNFTSLDPGKVHLQIIKPLQLLHKEFLGHYARGLTGVDITKIYQPILESSKNIKEQQLTQAQQTVAQMQGKGFNSLERALATVPGGEYSALFRSLYNAWEGNTQAITDNVFPVPAMTLFLKPLKLNKTSVLNIRLIPSHGFSGVIEAGFNAVYTRKPAQADDEIKFKTDLGNLWKTRQSLSDVSTIQANLEQIARFSL